MKNESDGRLDRCSLIVNGGVDGFEFFEEGGGLVAVGSREKVEGERFRHGCDTTMISNDVSE